MSSRRSDSSASDAPRGAVPLIGAVVMIPSFVVRSDSGDADTSENPSSFIWTKPEYGAGFDAMECEKTVQGSDCISPSHVRPKFSWYN